MFVVGKDWFVGRVVGVLLNLNLWGYGSAYIRCISPYKIIDWSSRDASAYLRHIVDICDINYPTKDQLESLLVQEDQILMDQGSLPYPDNPEIELARKTDIGVENE